MGPLHAGPTDLGRDGSYNYREEAIGIAMQHICKNDRAAMRDAGMCQAFRSLFFRGTVRS